MRWTFLYKGLVLAAVPLASQLIFAWAYFDLLSAAQDSMKRVCSWQQFCFQEIEVQTSIQKGFSLSLLVALSDSHQAKSLFRQECKQFGRSFNELKKQIEQPEMAEAGRQMPLIASADPKTMLALPIMIATHPASRAGTVMDALDGVLPGGFAVFVQRFQWAEQQKERAIDAINRASQLVDQNLAQFDHHSDSIDDLVRNLFLGDSLIAICLSLFFSASIARRIAGVRQNVVMLARRQALRPPVKGADEIAYLDQELHDCAQELYRLESFKHQMVSVVSHELKAPLASIQGTISLLSQGAFGSVGTEIVSRCLKAEQNLNRLIRLVNDLLALERLETHGFKLEVSEFGSSELVHDSITAIEGMAAARKIKIESEGADLHLVGDRDRLIQVLTNLLSNAIKFSDQDGIVRIRTESDGQDLCIKVINHGRGIPPEFRERLFKRFSQVEAADGAKRGGSGLGLAIAKTIVEQHSGTIGFDTNENETTFWFRLPYRGAAQPVVSAQESRSGLSFRLRHKGVILVLLPLLFNVLCLAELNRQWHEVKASLAQSRQATAAAGQLLLTGQLVGHAFWWAVIVNGSDIPQAKEILQRTIGDEKNERKKLLAISGDDVLYLKSFLQNADTMLESADQISKDQKKLSIEQAQKAGYFDRWISVYHAADEFLAEQKERYRKCKARTRQAFCSHQTFVTGSTACKYGPCTAAFAFLYKEHFQSGRQCAYQSR